MKFINYKNGEAYLEGVALNTVAEKFSTPCYIYSQQVIEENYYAFSKTLYSEEDQKQHFICYAVKANSNLHILNLFARLGAGFDIVSGGELASVLRAGGDPRKIVFSGVGKQAAEITQALQANIFCFNVESESELLHIQDLAKQIGKIAAFALRINPNINPQTHPYIATGLKNNKFGITLDVARNLIPKIKNLSHVRMIGLACHLGSQLVTLEPFVAAAEYLKELYLELSSAGIQIQYINLGGGLGVRYRDEQPPAREHYVRTLQRIFGPYPLNIILEPGRSIIAEAGILLTRVQYLKHTNEKNFAVVDAAMNDLMRPALYQTWQDIIPITIHPKTRALDYDIVGPICESADSFGQNRRLRLQPKDLLAILTVGAYGFSMSSNYNLRPRPAEVLIEHRKPRLIRRRQTIEELLVWE